MSFLEKIYPPEIRKQELTVPLMPLFRILSLPLALLGILFKVHPNILTIISFFTLLSSAYFAIETNFFTSSILMIITLCLDCADGEVARFHNKKTTLGLNMESIHADITLLIYPISVATGMFKLDIIQLSTLLLVMIGSSFYVNWRVIFSNSTIKDDPSGKSLIYKLFFSQQKPNQNIRNSTVIGNILFSIRLNLVTQLGVPFILIIIFGLVNISNARIPLIILGVSHLALAIGVILAKLFFKR
jgi:hypothetical protein|tara:strand:- start:1640 stop:2371 length:732 start_codon:yes stop_codon:yes gene_type:complete